MERIEYPKIAFVEAQIENPNLGTKMNEFEKAGVNPTYKTNGNNVTDLMYIITADQRVRINNGFKNTVKALPENMFEHSEIKTSIFDYNSEDKAVVNRAIDFIESVNNYFEANNSKVEASYIVELNETNRTNEPFSFRVNATKPVLDLIDDILFKRI